MTKLPNLDYDVVLSFAGEDRKYVEETANHLRQEGVKVFYDSYEDTNLWGKDLYQHLDDVYQNKAKFAVIFISEAYSRKLWTNHELKSAQARAFTESQEYILPVRFDDTEIPGIRKTLGYLDLRSLTPEDLAKKVKQKLGNIETENFLPRDNKYVRKIIKAIFEGLDDEEIDSHIIHVFLILQKTTPKERALLTAFIFNSCHHDITEDIHEDITMIERVTGITQDEVLEIAKGLYNLGFEYKIQNKKLGSKRSGNQVNYDEISIKLMSRKPELALENLTPILILMYKGASRGMCNQHRTRILERLDFSMLNQETDQKEVERIVNENCG